MPENYVTISKIPIKFRIFSDFFAFFEARIYCVKRVITADLRAKMPETSYDVTSIKEMPDSYVTSKEMPGNNEKSPQKKEQKVSYPCRNMCAQNPQFAHVTTRFKN